MFDTPPPTIEQFPDDVFPVPPAIEDNVPELVWDVPIVNFALPETFPETVNASEGVAVPIPTLLPVTTNTFCPYCPITTVLFANASITGKPAIVLTENNEFDKSSDIENNVPLFPLTVNISVLPVEPEPSNVREPEASWVRVCV